MSLTNALANEAEAIKALMADADQAIAMSIVKSLKAGAKLSMAKAECGHGNWLPFLERAGVQERKAQRLIKLSESGLKSDSVSDLGGVTAALEFIKKRDKAVALLNSLELDVWADVFAQGTQLIDEGVGPTDIHLLGAIPKKAWKARDSDMAKLLLAMELMQDAADMFSDDEQYARAA